MKKSLLYTRTGDQGLTSLVDGSRVPKNSPRVEAYGSVDELNAFIGLLLSHIKDLSPDEAEILTRVSDTLFNIGGCLATPVSPSDTSAAESLLGDIMSRTQLLERSIDRLDSEVPPLRSFILPGGCTAAAHAHVARAMCRNAERRILSFASTGEWVSPSILTYINRLSDYLFILARYLNHISGVPDTPWHK